MLLLRAELTHHGRQRLVVSLSDQWNVDVSNGLLVSNPRFPERLRPEPWKILNTYSLSDGLMTFCVCVTRVFLLTGTTESSGLNCKKRKKVRDESAGRLCSFT